MNLPGKKWEMQQCSVVSVKIDDKKPETVVDPAILRLADIKLTRRIDLGPGETAELEVPLAWVFKIPKDWKKLEVRGRGLGPRAFSGTLMLER